ncbi:MAG: Abi family protein [Cyanobacteria bacterium P01_C01_bin.69]
MQFDKPPLTTTEQIDLLLDRGLLIPDRDKAAHYLRHLNYYRLGAYWLPFEADHATHQFYPGTNFDDVLGLYIFDREFRLLVLDAIERIEVSIRAVWAYEMAHRHGPHCQLKRELFKSKWDYVGNYKSMKKELSRSNEAFIRHLKDKYDEELPPIWAMVEVMTFGQLSNWYNNTRHRQDRNAVAERYELDEKILTSLLHHLTIVRNTCAHHARLWNREFPVIPTLPKKGVLALSQSSKRKIYNTLVLILHLMDQISPEHHWNIRLLSLLNHHKINTESMGFPDNWNEQPLWTISV